MLASAITQLAPRLRFQFTKPIIENTVFKLHYKLTVTMLLAFVFLVCATELFGDQIRCLSDLSVASSVIQRYCFFMATFTIVRHYNESLLQSGFLPHPGVGPLSESDETLHHTYYQWVPFVLFLQSICFYMPHYIWKSKEGGRIRALVDGLQYASLSLKNQDMTVKGMNVPSQETVDKRLALIKRDIILRLKISRTWSVWLVSMEVVNLLHVMFEIWIINKFLNGQFIGLGPAVLNYSDWNQISDPLETVFPKVTKCIFHKYGPSGSIQQHDALCVMALNIIHEKIYTVLWFWLLFLFIVSLLAVIWRCASFFLYRRSLRFNQMMFNRVSSGKVDPYNVIRVVNGCEFGDWLFLYYLAKNMHGFIFQRLFIQLSEELLKQETPKQVTPDSEPSKEKGEVEPVEQVDFNDETLPLKDVKKVS